jgi:hypothetical protein
MSLKFQLPLLRFVIHQEDSNFSDQEKMDGTILVTSELDFA